MSAYDSITGRLDDLAGLLGVSLAQWETRDDSKAQPEVRQAANTARDAIDAMIAALRAAGAQLAAEMRQSDDVAMARADALLARVRHQRRGGRP